MMGLLILSNITRNFTENNGKLILGEKIREINLIKSGFTDKQLKIK